MTSIDTISSPAPIEIVSALAVQQAEGPPTGNPSDEKRSRRAPIVLDMGEASRAQGFKLNGCR